MRVGVALVAVDDEDRALRGRDRIHGPQRVLKGNLLTRQRPCPQFVGQGLQARQALDACHELHVIDGLGEEVVAPASSPATRSDGWSSAVIISTGMWWVTGIGLEAAATSNPSITGIITSRQNDIDVTGWAQISSACCAGNWRQHFEILGGEARFEQAHIGGNVVRRSERAQSR